MSRDSEIPPQGYLVFHFLGHFRGHGPGRSGVFAWGFCLGFLIGVFDRVFLRISADFCGFPLSNRSGHGKRGVQTPNNPIIS